MLAQASCGCSSSAHRRSRAVPNEHLKGVISAIWATTANMGDDDENMATTQLDSHANMIVVGRQATVFGSSGKHTDVRPFSNDCSKLEAVLIVDAAIAYDCPCSRRHICQQ